MTEFEFSWQKSLLHNLGWALLPAMLPMIPKVARKVNRLKMSIFAPQDYVMQQTMSLLNKVKALKAIGTPSANKQIEKLLKKLDGILSDESLATMKRLKSEVANHHAHMDDLRKEKNRLAKLGESTDDIEKKIAL